MLCCPIVSLHPTPRPKSGASNGCSSTIKCCTAVQEINALYIAVDNGAVQYGNTLQYSAGVQHSSTIQCRLE